MCSQSVLKRLLVRYENASSEIDSSQKMSRKRMVPEVVYEGNQFALENVADLENWYLRWLVSSEGSALANLRNVLLDEKNITVRYHVISKELMRLGHRLGSAKKLVRFTRITAHLMAKQSAIQCMIDGNSRKRDQICIFWARIRVLRPKLPKEVPQYCLTVMICKNRNFGFWAR